MIVTSSGDGRDIPISALRLLGLPLLLLLGGCRTPLAQLPHLTELQAVASWSTAQQDGETRIFIQSPRGIGRARLVQPADGWPPTVIISLELAALEGFTVAWDQQRARTEFTRQGKALNWERSPSGLALPAHITRHQGTIEIRLPAAWLRPEITHLDLQWVDYYR